MFFPLNQRAKFKNKNYEVNEYGSHCCHHNSSLGELLDLLLTASFSKVTYYLC